MFLIDTATFSESVRARPDAGVRSWFEATPAGLLFTSVIVIGEVASGLARKPNGLRSAWLATTREEFSDRILPVTVEVAEFWGDMAGRASRAGNTLPVADSLIAATAIVHNLTVVTRNTRDFERCGARVLNPWTGVP